MIAQPHILPTTTQQHNFHGGARGLLYCQVKEMPYLRSLLKLGAFFLLVLCAIALYHHGSTSTSSPIIQSFTPPGQRDLTFPRVASWKTWFHPLQFPTASGPRQDRKGWNLLQHLGGNGPWIEKIDDRAESSNLAPPGGCSIEQVHLVCIDCRTASVPFS